MSRDNSTVSELFPRDSGLCFTIKPKQIVETTGTVSTINWLTSLLGNVQLRQVQPIHQKDPIHKERFVHESDITPTKLM